MTQYAGINLSGNSSSEIADALIALDRSLEYQMSHLDSGNVQEIGGWQVGMTSLISTTGLVGLSSAGLGSTAVRFWAGDVNMDNAPFRVYDDGTIVASNAQITGGSILFGTGNVTPPDYSIIAGSKPPADANNTYSELLYNSNIRGFVNVGGLLFLSADYIYAGTLTGITVQTASGSSSRVIMNNNGFHSYDSTGVQRLSIGADGQYFEMDLYGQSGAIRGSLSAYDSYVQLVSLGTAGLLFSAAAGITITSQTPFIDFGNIQIRNFAGNVTAVFG